MVNKAMAERVKAHVDFYKRRHVQEREELIALRMLAARLPRNFSVPVNMSVWHAYYPEPSLPTPNVLLNLEFYTTQNSADELRKHLGIRIWTKKLEANSGEPRTTYSGIMCLGDSVKDKAIPLYLRVSIIVSGLPQSCKLVAEERIIPEHTVAAHTEKTFKVVCEMSSEEVKA